MGLPNKDELEGQIEAAKGAVKERIGQVIGNQEMENAGAVEHNAGEAQHQLGKMKRQVGDVIGDIGEFVGK